MGQKETVRAPNLPGSATSIHLDNSDLKHLSLLRMFGSYEKFADPRRAILIPNRAVDGDLRALLNELSSTGRIITRTDKPRVTVDPHSSGNTVVRPSVMDATVMEAFVDVNPRALGAVLDLVGRRGNILKSVDIFPNFSPHGLKGVALEIDTKVDKWWRDLATYNWPIGRGIIVSALPVGAEEFIDRSDFILPLVDAIGKASSGIYKYVRFFYDSEDNRVFMAVSAGPSREERASISEQLANIHRPGKARELMASLSSVFSQRRKNLTVSLSREMGFDGATETVSETPYVFLDIDRGSAISGGVPSGVDLIPFGLRDDGLIIYRDASEKVHPLGLKRAETKKPIPNFFSQTKINLWAESLSQPIILKDLIVGYHSAK